MPEKFHDQSIRTSRRQSRVFSSGGGQVGRHGHGLSQILGQVDSSRVAFVAAIYDNALLVEIPSGYGITGVFIASGDIDAVFLIDGFPEHEILPPGVDAVGVVVCLPVFIGRPVGKHPIVAVAVGIVPIDRTLFKRGGGRSVRIIFPPGFVSQIGIVGRIEHVILAHGFLESEIGIQLNPGFVVRGSLAGRDQNHAVCTPRAVNGR